MPQADSVQWVELHGLALVGARLESAIEALEEAEFKVMVSEFPRHDDFPSPRGDRVYLHIDAAQVIKKVEAQ